VHAYSELEREGLVYKKRGTGTFVSDEAVGMAAAEKQRIVARSLHGAIDEGRSLGLTDAQLRQAFDEQLNHPDSRGEA
jgi:DNA-binding transcriptional regulator YhcF (GntR family)